MLWLTVIGIVVSVLMWFLGKLKKAVGREFTTEEKKKLANAAYLCTEVVLESNRCGVQPEAPAEAAEPPTVADPPRTPAAMRATLQNGFDRLLGLPRFVLGAADRSMVYAQQSFWQAADDATLQKLIDATPAMLAEPTGRDDAADADLSHDE